MASHKGNNYEANATLNINISGEERIRELESELSRANEYISELQSEMYGLRDTMEQLKDTSFVGQLEADLQRAQDTIKRFANASKAELTAFLKVNNVDGILAGNIWGQHIASDVDLGKFEKIIADVKRGAITSQEAIQQVKASYSSLITQMNSDGAGADTQALTGIISTMEKLSTTVQAVYEQVMMLKEGGVKLAEGFSAQTSGGSGGGVGGTIESLEKLKQYAEGISPDLQVAYDSIERIVVALNDFAGVDASRLLQVSQTFSGISKIGEGTFTSKKSENILALFNGLKNVNVGSMAWVGTLGNSLKELSGIKISKTIATSLESISKIDVPKLGVLSTLNFDNILKLKDLKISSAATNNLVQLGNVVQALEEYKLKIEELQKAVGITTGGSGGGSGGGGGGSSKNTVLAKGTAEYSEAITKITRLQKQAKKELAKDMDILGAGDSSTSAYQAGISNLDNLLQKVQQGTMTVKQFRLELAQATEVLGLSDVKMTDTVISKTDMVDAGRVSLEAVEKYQRLSNKLTTSLSKTTGSGMEGFQNGLTSIISRLEAANNAFNNNVATNPVNAYNALSDKIRELSLEYDTLTRAAQHARDIMATSSKDATNEANAAKMNATALKQVESLQTVLANGGQSGSAVYTELERIKGEYQSIFNMFNGSAKDQSAFDAYRRGLTELSAEFINAQSAAESFMNQIKTANGYERDIARAANDQSEVIGNASRLMSQLQNTRGGTAQAEYAQLANYINNVRAAYSDFETAMRGSDADARATAYSKFSQRLLELKQSFTDASTGAKIYVETMRTVETEERRQKSQNNANINNLNKAKKLYGDLVKKLHEYSAAQNGKASGNYRELENDAAALQSLISSYEHGTISADEFKAGLDRISGSVATNEAAIRSSGEATLSFADRMKKAFTSISSYFSAYTIFFRFISAMKEMISTSIEIDSALTQLKIVTGASNTEMSKFYETSSNLARELGNNITDVVSSIETFSRLGYNLDESSTLAKYASIMANVAGVSSDEATTGITSIIKGYQLSVSDSEHVANVLIQVGQKYAVSASEMMEAYGKCGAALNATGVTFEKSAGLIAAANASIQDASTVGTALKTVSARIRKSTTELEEMGEDTSDLAEGFSKYAEELKALTGFDIMENGSTSDFKDLYDIFEGLSRTWDSLTETQQARVAEILGGTRQLQVISSILGNWSDAAGAYADAMDSAGVATTAQEKYMGSVAAHVSQFKAAVQDLSHDLFESDILTFFVDLGTLIIDVLDKITGIINAMGGLKTVLIEVASVISVIKADAIVASIAAIVSNIGAAAVAIKTFVEVGLVSLFSSAGGLAISAAPLVAAAVAAVALIANAVAKSRAEIKERENEILSTGAASVSNARDIYDEYNELNKLVASEESGVSSSDALARAKRELAAAMGLEGDEANKTAGSLKDLAEAELKAAKYDAEAAFKIAEDNIEKQRSKIIDKFDLGGQWFNPWFDLTGGFKGFKTSVEGETDAEAALRMYQDLITMRNAILDKYEDGGKMSANDELFYDMVVESIDALQPYVDAYKSAAGDLNDIQQMLDGSYGQLEESADAAAESASVLKTALSGVISDDMSKDIDAYTKNLSTLQSALSAISDGTFDANAFLDLMRTEGLEDFAVYADDGANGWSNLSAAIVKFIAEGKSSEKILAALNELVGENSKLTEDAQEYVLDLIKAIDNVDSSAIESVQSSFEGTTAAIRDAIAANNEFKNSLADNSHDAGFLGMSEIFKDFYELISEGKFGDVNFDKYSRYFGVQDLSPEDIVKWAKANKELYGMTDEKTAVGKFLSQIQKLQDTTLKGIASYDSASGSFWLDTDRTAEAAAAMGMTEYAFKNLVGAVLEYSEDYEGAAYWMAEADKLIADGSESAAKTAESSSKAVVDAEEAKQDAVKETTDANVEATKAAEDKAEAETKAAEEAKKAAEEKAEADRKAAEEAAEAAKKAAKEKAEAEAKAREEARQAEEDRRRKNQEAKVTTDSARSDKNTAYDLYLQARKSAQSASSNADKVLSTTNEEEAKAFVDNANAAANAAKTAYESAAESAKSAAEKADSATGTAYENSARQLADAAEKYANYAKEQYDEAVESAQLAESNYNELVTANEERRKSEEAAAEAAKKAAEEKAEADKKAAEEAAEAAKKAAEEKAEADKKAAADKAKNSAAMASTQEARADKWGAYSSYTDARKNALEAERAASKAAMAADSETAQAFADSAQNAADAAKENYSNAARYAEEAAANANAAVGTTSEHTARQIADDAIKYAEAAKKELDAAATSASSAMNSVKRLKSAEDERARSAEASENEQKNGTVAQSAYNDAAQQAEEAAKQAGEIITASSYEEASAFLSNAQNAADAAGTAYANAAEAAKNAAENADLAIGTSYEETARQIADDASKYAEQAGDEYAKAQQAAVDAQTNYDDYLMRMMSDMDAHFSGERAKNAAEEAGELFADASENVQQAEDELAKNVEGTSKSLEDALNDAGDTLTESGFIEACDEIAEAWDDASPALKINGLTNGNVDYTNRPHVGSKAMQDAGWSEFPSGAQATLYSSEYTIGSGEALYTISVTPIMEDGTVMTPDAVTEYINSLVTDNGEAALLASDTKNLVLNVQPGEYDKEYWDDFYGSIEEYKQQELADYNREIGQLVDASRSDRNAAFDSYTQAMVQARTAAAEAQKAMNASTAEEAKTFADNAEVASNAAHQSYLKAVDGYNRAAHAAEEAIGTPYEHTAKEIADNAKKYADQAEQAYFSAFDSATFAQQRYQALSAGELSDKTKDVIQEISDTLSGDTTTGIDVEVTAETSDAVDALNSVTTAVNSIPSEKTVTVKVKQEGGVDGELYQKNASGTKHAKEGLSLVNEEGPELISDNGKAYIAGGGKPTLTYLSEGAVVLTADETKKALKNKNIGNGVGAYRTGKEVPKDVDPEPVTSTGKTSKTLSATIKIKDKTTKSGSGKSKKKTFADELKEYQHMLKMEQITQQEYLDWLDAAYQKAYENGEIKLDDFRKYEEEVFSGRKELFGDWLNDQEFQIEQLNRELDPNSATGFKDNSAAVINIYNNMIAEIEKQISAAYDRGLTNNDDYVQELYKSMYGYQDKVKDMEDDSNDESKDNLEDLIQYRIKMIQKELEKRKEALKEELDEYKKFIDEQKKLLEDEADDEKYYEDQAEKRKKVTDLEIQLSQLELDNSAWATKKKIELREDLAEAKKDLDDFEKDHALDVAKEELDAQYDAREELVNQQIQDIEDYLENAENLYNQALEDIRNNSVALYEEMVAYEKYYESGTAEAVTEMWDNAYDALKNYYDLHQKAYKEINLVDATGNKGGLPTGYASGTSNATRGIHSLWEEGDEFLFKSSNGTTYRMFSGGEKVLSASATNFLYNFANSGGSILGSMVSSAIGNIMSNGSGSNLSQIRMGDIIINGNANERTVSEIRRAQRENLDTMLKELNKLNR